DLWVNGRKVAGAGELQGAYSQLEYDVTRLVRDGQNAVALEVFPNDWGDHGYLTLSMVDWNPPSPGQFTGLQFAPDLAQDGAVSLRNAHVVQRDAADLSRADITIAARLRNNTDNVVRATLSGTLTGNGANVPFSRGVTLPAHATRAVRVGSA